MKYANGRNVLNLLLNSAPTSRILCGKYGDSGSVAKCVTRLEKAMARVLFLGIVCYIAQISHKLTLRYIALR